MAKIKVNNNTPPPLRLEKSGGVDFSTTLSQIEIFRSPDMLNMVLDERGLPEKRTGYDEAIPIHLGLGKINSMYQWNGKTYIAKGTDVFAFDDADIT